MIRQVTDGMVTSAAVIQICRLMTTSRLVSSQKVTDSVVNVRPHWPERRFRKRRDCA